MTVTVKNVHLSFVLNFALICLLEENYVTMSKIKNNALKAYIPFLYK